MMDGTVWLDLFGVKGVLLTIGQRPELRMLRGCLQPDYNFVA